ncbi:DUF305 domain-containing protein [Olivibacter sp. XZL3]|uniref:DUF305 domain-containing protein n=1 Tax=Olivibacter sp. XZL3 TaxID=1735116 RepID=UPI00106521AD|nr:DUF305 domain-containing protein [Olivibacter sp. XZL3]
MNGQSSYGKFGMMMLVSFVVMYAVMFLNVDRTQHIYLSLTRFYMALLMVAPMAISMMLFMWKMYADEMMNKLIILAAVLVFIFALVFLRNQTFVSDRQYMKAMIPHHSSAIMTSRHANIKDPEVRKLADSIIQSQRREIAQMKAALKRLEESEAAK